MQSARELALRIEMCKKIAGPYADGTAPLSTAPRLTMELTMDYILDNLD
jgi:hypothetical protein